MSILMQALRKKYLQILRLQFRTCEDLKSYLKHVTSSFVIFFVSVFFLIKSRFGNAIYLKFVIFLLIVSFRLMSSKGSGSTFSVFNFNSSFQNNLTKTLDIELLISHHAEIREGGRSKKYFRLLI